MISMHTIRERLGHVQSGDRDQHLRILANVEIPQLITAYEELSTKVARLEHRIERLENPTCAFCERYCDLSCCEE